MATQQANASKSNDKILWILDAGHGKETPGKRSPEFGHKGTITQFFEWEFNRDIRDRILEKGKAKGLDIVFANYGKHDEPLNNRCKQANESAKGRRAILISIHANAGPKTGWQTANGVEVYAHPSSLTSIRLSKLFQRDLVGVTGMANRGAKVANFAILTHTKMPAILTENGFFTNRLQVANLLDPAFRDKIADAHVLTMLQIDPKTIPVCL